MLRDGVYSSCRPVKRVILNLLLKIIVKMKGIHLNFEQSFTILWENKIRLFWFIKRHLVNEMKPFVILLFFSIQIPWISNMNFFCSNVACLKESYKPFHTIFKPSISTFNHLWKPFFPITKTEVVEVVVCIINEKCCLFAYSPGKLFKWLVVVGQPSKLPTISNFR